MIVGQAWYERDEFYKFRSLCSDASDMSPTYEIWLAGAEECAKESEMLGDKIHRVMMDSNGFLIWATDKGLYLNGEGRTAYCNYLLAKQFGFGK